MATFRFAIATALVASVLPIRSNAEIVIDTTLDGGFFTDNPTALTALNAAVTDINQLILFDLGAVTNDITTGTDGSHTVNVDFNYQISNPSTGVSFAIDDTTLPENEIRLFVGARPIGSPVLGRGGPGGVGISSGASGPAGSDDFQPAIDSAIASDQHRRGGPVINSLNVSFGNGSGTFDVGPSYGSLFFDNDTNDDGVADSTAELEDSWNFDHTLAEGSFDGKNDFYSVALHEMLHSIGLGPSDAFNSLVNGDDWLGSEVSAIVGSGDNNIIDGAHIAEGTMSFVLSTSEAQEVAMSPSLTTGTRKSLTELDAAFLRDLGFETATAVPEPGSLLVLAGLGFMVRQRSRKAKRLRDIC